MTVQSIPSPKAGEGFWLWFLKLLSGVLIVAVLILHLVVNHFVAEGGLLTWQDVVNYYQNPWVRLMEGAFVTLVVSHSLMGLRSIILDLKPSPGVLRLVSWAFVVLGAGFILYGWWLIQAVAAFGA